MCSACENASLFNVGEFSAALDDCTRKYGVRYEVVILVPNTWTGLVAIRGLRAFPILDDGLMITLWREASLCDVCHVWKIADHDRQSYELMQNLIELSMMVDSDAAMNSFIEKTRDRVEMAFSHTEHAAEQTRKSASPDRRSESNSRRQKSGSSDRRRRSAPSDRRKTRGTSGQRKRSASPEQLYLTLLNPADAQPAKKELTDNDRIEALSYAISKYPRQRKLFVQRGDIHYRMKEYNLAVKDYSAALQLGESVQVYQKRSRSFAAMYHEESAQHDRRMAQKLFFV